MRLLHLYGNCLKKPAFEDFIQVPRAPDITKNMINELELRINKLEIKFNRVWAMLKEWKDGQNKETS